MEGMIQVARYARMNDVPYFGICLGLQVMVIEFARDVVGIDGADSSEFAPDSDHLVISLLEEQVDVKNYGGTMRLGLNDSHLMAGSLVRKIYGRPVIQERHRHRYEVSNQYRQMLEEAGLVVAGVTPDHSLVEAVQWKNHPWGIGVQFHPEFRSKPSSAHPLFAGFVAAAIENAGLTVPVVGEEARR